MAVPGAFNFRDLGGIAVASGTVAPGRVFRSDLLHRAEIEIAHDALAALGVVTVVDLRVLDERHADGALDGHDDLEVHHVSLLSEVWSWDDEVAAVEDTFLRDRSIEMFDHRGERIAEVMRIFVEAPAGAVAFHCTAGKDRTGVVAAALLGLLGASDAEIVADYARSAAAMPAIAAWFHEQNPVPALDPEVSDRLRRRAAMPETMQGVLDHIRSRHGGFSGWAREVGLVDAEVTALRQRLVAPAQEESPPAGRSGAA